MKRVKNKKNLEEIFAVKEAHKFCIETIFNNFKEKHKNRPNNLIDYKELEHMIHEFLRIFFTIEINEHDNSNFKYRLTTDRIKFPIFSFDSCGLSHTNKNKIPLKDSIVDCPHFHFYDNEGVKIAYKIKEMQTHPDDFKNFQKCLKYFFTEGNIFEKNGKIIIDLKGKSKNLFPLMFKNPLNGVDFN